MEDDTHRADYDEGEHRGPLELGGPSNVAP